MDYTDSQIPPDHYTEVPMNVFLFDQDYTLSAKLHPNKLIGKLVCEQVQLLSSVVRQFAPDYAERIGVYKLSHAKHPCTLWAMSSKANFLELCERTQALHDEYLRRGYNWHKSYNLISRLRKAADHITFKPVVNLDLTPDGYAMAFNAVSGITKDYSQSAIPQYRAYLLTKSYTQPYDAGIYYILDYPDITLVNPELIQLRNDLLQSNHMEAITLDTFQCHAYGVFFELHRLGHTPDELHQAYFYLLRAQGFNQALIDTYQKFCGDYLDYTVAPLYRDDAKPKAKKSTVSKPAAKPISELVAPKSSTTVTDNADNSSTIEEWSNEVDSLNSLLNVGIKPISLKRHSGWSQARFLSHIYYWLRLKASNTSNWVGIAKFNKLPNDQERRALVTTLIAFIKTENNELVRLKKQC